MGKIKLNMTQIIHFIGIGGISMSGLAEVLKKDGYFVSGSDDMASDITNHLKSLGIEVNVPNAAENISEDTDLVVYTAAVRENNPEFQAAKRMNKRMMERAELLGEILKGYDHAICIAGTHGKTTTTSIFAEVALAAGLDPTISIGGHMGTDGSNYRVGQSSYFVMEACEYSNSFHHWHPHVGVILNIDADHLDFFGDLDGVVSSFRKFAENIRPGGLLVVRAGQPGLDIVTAGLECDVVTFALNQHEARFWVDDVEYDNLGRPSFDVMDGKQFLAHITLPLPGQYNMLNALACFAAAEWLGIDTQVTAQALMGAKGVKRRFQYKGTYNGAEIIDDYAHHPTEIQACLAAAKRTGRRVVCLFQPHTYSRTKNHLNEFVQSFDDADLIVLLPIYAAREPFDPSISSAVVTEMLNVKGSNSVHFNSFEKAEQYLRKNLHPNDMLITMGAGDVYKVGESLLST